MGIVPNGRLHMSISQYRVFKIFKGTMPLKDVYPKKMCSYAPAYPPPLTLLVEPL